MMQINLSDSVSLLMLNTRFDYGSAAAISLTGLGGVVYGLWMILRPNSYWKMIRGQLEGLESEILDLSKHSRRVNKLWALKVHIDTANPNRKARMIGCFIILLSLVFILAIWREPLFGLIGW